MAFAAFGAIPARAATAFSPSLPEKPQGQACGYRDEGNEDEGGKIHRRKKIHYRGEMYNQGRGGGEEENPQA